MQISKSNLELLVMLKNNPMASFNELAQKLDISPNTVKIRIEKLKNLEILRNDDIIFDPVLGNRRISERICYVNPYNLGLLKIFYILKEISSYSNYVLICNFLDKHPYTTYRTMVMGQGFNIYCEFQIPPLEQNLLEQFISNVKSQKLFKDYIMIDPTEIHRCDTDISRWNINITNWDVNLYKSSQKDKSSIEASFHKFRNNINNDIHVIPNIISKPKLKEIDLKILRELTINGKPNVNYIASLYEKDKTLISRKIQKVRELYISHFNIAYNKSIFQLGSEFLIYGKMESSTKYAIKKLIIENIIPYQTKYTEDKKYFIMRIEAPPFFVNDLVRLIAPHCSLINQLVLHKKTNARYYFYYENYDFENKKWKGGEEYIIHEPLRN